MVATKTIQDRRITSINALVMPQLVIDENPMSMVSEETVLSGRQCISQVLVNPDYPEKILIVSLESQADGHGYSCHSVTRFAEKLCCLKRSWQRSGIPVHVVLELDLSRLLDRNSLRSAQLTDRLLARGGSGPAKTSEAGAFNRAIMSVRALLAEITRMGLVCAVSLDDPLMPQYFGDQLSWCVFKEENIESQLHRQLASAMSMPVAFAPVCMAEGPGKSLDACLSAKGEHTFFSMTKEGAASLVSSSGNSHCHIIVPWKDRSQIEGLKGKLESKNVTTRLLLEVDQSTLQTDTSEVSTLLKNVAVAGLRVSTINEDDVDPSSVFNNVAQYCLQDKSESEMTEGSVKRQRVH